MQGKSWNPVDMAVNGVSKYYNNFQKVGCAHFKGCRQRARLSSSSHLDPSARLQDFTALFQVWFPADIILFSLPMWLRMPCRHLVSLGWTSYLSFLRGSSIPDKPK